MFFPQVRWERKIFNRVPGIIHEKLSVTHLNGGAPISPACGKIAGYISEKWVIVNRATWRFYSELNDFLPIDQRQKDIPCSFNEGQSVKHLIESLGVPHPEVDLILVNGDSVGYEYQVRDGDRVSVYPLFNALDIADLSQVRPQPLLHPRFILDAHLGRLASYLRMLGFDTLYRNDYQDEELARRSSIEERILLTRDRGLLKRGLVKHGYCLRTTNPEQQIVEIIRRFSLLESITPFSRCIRCNGLLKPAEKSVVEESIPQKTRSYFDEFIVCDSCGRVYWNGSHVQRMNALIDRIKKQVTVYA